MSPAVDVTSHQAETRPGGSRPPRRADLDGLRAVAITLVVVYHVWIGRVSGGVDVFLFLSAFLLTGSFVRRIDAGDPLRVGEYWLRRFARLLPLVAVTLVGVLLTAMLVYPPERWRAVWDQTIGSVLYMQNVVLSGAAVDYYARTDQTSPLQHFWSLSIQGQVFLLWPVLLMLVAVIARRSRLTGSGAAAVVFGVVFLSSFASSLVLTSSNQQAAYFSTPARLWEFALGSLVAVAVSRVRVRALTGAILIAVGLVGVIACGMVLDVENAFPGWAALWPTVCAALIVVGGASSPRSLPVRVLSAAPLQWLAGISYAFYLVHWPILVTWMVVSERERPGILAGGFLIALSVAAAWALRRWVDAPVQRWLRRGGAVSTAIAVAVSVVVVVAPTLAWRQLEVSSAAQLGPEHPGAAAVLSGQVSAEFGAPPRPFAADIAWPWFEPGEDCSRDNRGMGETCFHRASGVEQPYRVAIVGNSHSQQWGAMLDPVALDRDWDVTLLVAGGCPLGLDDVGTRAPGFCDAWREGVFSALADLQPDLVVTVGSTTVAGSNEEYISPGLDRAIDRVRETTHADVWVLRDNPRFDFDMWDCAHSDDADTCEVDASTLLAEENPLDAFDDGERVRAIDVTPFVCPDGVCRPLVGNIYVFFDDNHVTTDYARSLSWAILDELPA